MQNGQYMINMLNNMNYNNNLIIQNIASYEIYKEFQKCLQDEDLLQIGCTFKLNNNNIYQWKVTMYGPKKTPYENGIFTIIIKFPFEYPNHGPKFEFMQKVYHLNVGLRDDPGYICINHLNEWRTCGKVFHWPNYRIKQALFDIFCFFIHQGVEEAHDEERGKQYVQNRQQFDDEARKWTLKYANPI